MERPIALKKKVEVAMRADEEISKNFGIPFKALCDRYSSASSGGTHPTRLGVHDDGLSAVR